MSVDTTGAVSPTTTTTGQAAVLSGVTNGNSSSPATAAQASQFGQFRLTTFVDSNPRPNTTAGALAGTSSSATASPIPRPASVPVTVEKNMAATTASNGGRNENASPITHAAKKAQMGVATNGPNSSPIQISPITADAAIQAVGGAMHRRTASAKATLPSGRSTIQHGMNNGFGVLDLTTPIIPQGKLSQHRDGRVRNPVPRKLKGKTDMRNGNFSVMHMDMSGALGDGKAGESRGEAAQRTSENTAKAAREAARDKEGGGKPIKRRRVDGDGAWEPILSSASQSRASMGMDGSMMRRMSISAPGPPKEIVHRTEMMTPEEVKWEQARLLTTLRSINPLTVVDQICKALAFFGGIPGAPPPEDGLFSDSADANGTGALFVGWLSEIFPDLERRSWASTAEAPQPAPIPQGKRPRGRPKGSKASKVRKDKGIKKGVKYGTTGLSNNNPIRADDVDDPADEDWIDIGIGDQDGAGGGDANGGDIVMMDEVNGHAAPQTSAKRRPGRPRGSKNSKKRDADGNEISSGDSMMQDIEGEDQQPAAPPVKRKVGRPPGSKTKPKDGAPPTPVTSVQPKATTKPAQSRAKSVVSGAMPADLSAEERAVLEAFRKNRALVPEGPSAVPKKKRPSRAKPKPAGAEQAAEKTHAAPAGVVTPEMLAQQLNARAPAAPQPQIAAPASSTSTIKPPPPKRQRKGKEQAPKAIGTSNAANSNSGIDPSLQNTETISASPHLQQSQQSQHQSRSTQPQRSSSMSTNPYTSPQMGNTGSMGNTLQSIEALMAAPASSSMGTGTQASRAQPQGLEAHYARFETLQGDRAESTQSPTGYTIGGTLGAARGGSNMAQQRGGGMNRSPIKSNAGINLYYQPQAQNQAQRLNSMGGSNQAGYGYNQPQQQASRGNPYSIENYGRGTRASLTSNTLSSNSQAPQNRSVVAYGVQGQNQNQNDYFSAGATSFVDLPALETGVGYGARSASYSGGGMAGGGMGSGGIGNGGIGGGLFGVNGQGPLSESELREQLLRADMARR